ncbi:MAG: chromosome segregation protein SMC [Lachnospiraceae bacterium]|jgi:chromosome segregation protein
MYLKSIEVQGFKSFANKITFEFHNGITGIVGPNGSGKSNVADAVRWVLGEQSAKQLRGGNMQDVIFSGTETRKPLGFAYVAITLDNADHKLPIDYEEITIARRLYRSGESEYLMNGTVCRLRDVHELFYDTGIGKEGYSIIGQGQIDRILSGKPEERRELFDEAAGIVKFKRRKAATLKKLEEEKQNLLRVTDILSELTRQIGPLEKQAETAKLFLKKKDKLKQLDIHMFLLEMRHMEKQLEEIQKKHEIAQADLQETTDNFNKTKAEYEELEQGMEELDAKIEESRNRSGQNALIRQQLENQIALLKEQIASSHQNDARFRERMTELQAGRAEKEEEILHHQQEKKQMDEQLSLLQKEQEEQQKRFEAFTRESHILAQKVEEAKNEIIELLNLRASTKGKMQRYHTMLEQIAIRKAELNQRALRMKQEEEQTKKSKEQNRQQLEQLRQLIEQLESESNEKEQEVQRLQEEIQRQNQQMDIGQTAYHREASRLESLRNLTERYEGYGNSIKRIMEQKKDIPGIKGVVADLIEVDKKYEVAIETALGGSIQNIVTDNEATAKKMIQFLKRNKYGRATFLPLTSMGNKKAFSNPCALQEEGVIGIASDLVHVDKAYEGMTGNLLGRTLVIDHMDHGVAIARKYQYSLRMVTVEGELLNPGGSLTGGTFRNNSNLLGRRREIEELESSVKALKADMERQQADIENNRQRRNQTRDEITGIAEKLQKLYLQQNTLRMNYQADEEKLSEMKNGYARLADERRQIDAQADEIEENSSSIQIELEVSAAEEKKYEEQVTLSQTSLEESRASEAEQTQILEKLHLQSANISSKRGFTKENLSRLSQEVESIDRQIEQMLQNLDEGAKSVAKKEQDIQEITLTMEAAEEEAAKEEQKIKEYLAAKEEMHQTHKGFFEKREELSDRMNMLDKECFRLNSQTEKLEETSESQINYMWEEYEVTYNQAKEMAPEEMGSRAALKKEIGEVKEEIRSLGTVNVNAIEDYKELLERHTFLQAQYEDLVKAEETLKGVIEELDTGMRNQFTEKFEQIRREFDSAFKELFGGGKGTLELMMEEENDVLEAGVQIIAQPPGKKLQNMMQLSGGEKALTAIALLFAIQNLKPSPFCLLDEIEAALDDSNVTRYAKYLHKLTKNTQFIIITHRKGTMVAADRLYGITMQEKGVSALVSVNLIEKDLEQ